MQVGEFDIKYDSVSNLDGDELTLEKVTLFDLEIEIKPEFYKNMKFGGEAKGKEADEQPVKQPEMQRWDKQFGQEKNSFRIVKVEFTNLKLIVHPVPEELRLGIPVKLPTEKKEFIIDKFVIANSRAEMLPEGQFEFAVKQYMLKSNIIDFNLLDFQANKKRVSWRDFQFAINPEHFAMIRERIDLNIQGGVQFADKKPVPQFTINAFTDTVNIAIDKKLAMKIKANEFTPSQYFVTAFPLQKIKFESELPNAMMLMLGMIPLQNLSFQIGETKFVQAPVKSGGAKKSAKLAGMLGDGGGMRFISQNSAPQTEIELHPAWFTMFMLGATGKRKELAQLTETGSLQISMSPEVHHSIEMSMSGGVQKAKYTNSRTGKLEFMVEVKDGEDQETLTRYDQQGNVILQRKQPLNTGIEDPKSKLAVKAVTPPVFAMKRVESEAEIKERLAQVLFANKVSAMSTEKKAALDPASAYFRVANPGIAGTGVNARVGATSGSGSTAAASASNGSTAVAAGQNKTVTSVRQGARPRLLQSPSKLMRQRRHRKRSCCPKQTGKSNKPAPALQFALV